MRTRVVHAARARAQWRELLDRVAHGGERILIVRNGREVAALVPPAMIAPPDPERHALDIDDARTAFADARGRPRTPWRDLLHACDPNADPGPPSAVPVECLPEFDWLFRLLLRQERMDVLDVLGPALATPELSGAEGVAGTRTLHRLQAGGWQVLLTRTKAGVVLVSFRRGER